MEALGHPEAAVTDLSEVYDFVPWVNAKTSSGRQCYTETEKLELQQIYDEKLKRLSDLMGREVTEAEYIWQLAQEVENRL